MDNKHVAQITVPVSMLDNWGQVIIKLAAYSMESPFDGNVWGLREECLDLLRRHFRDIEVRPSKGKPLFRRNIQEMAVCVLGPSQGLTALEIIEKIYNKYQVLIPRTSLSPQLTRLKNRGLIERDSRVWYVTPTPLLTGKPHDPT